MCSSDLATRVFRLCRIRGAVEPVGPSGAFDVPSDLDVMALVSTSPAGDQRESIARIEVEPGRGNRLRRIALSVAPSAQGSVLEVPYVDDEEFAGDLVSLGVGVVVLEPDDLRQAVIRRLTLAAGAAP